jgi:hypothetical protein
MGFTIEDPFPAEKGFLRLRMRGNIPPHPKHVFMAWSLIKQGCGTSAQ